VVFAQEGAQSLNVLFTETTSPVDSAGMYVMTRQWLAADACGNTTVGIQHINWIPNSFLACSILLPAGIDCNSQGVNISSNVSGGFGPYTYAWEIAGENCFIQAGQGTPEVAIYVGFTQAVISLTVTDAFGCVSFCASTVDCVYPLNNGLSGVSPLTNPETANADIPTQGVVTSSAQDYLQELNLWPNPATGTINLSFESMVNNKVTYSFINLLGQEIFSDQINAAKGFNAQRIDISLIPEGTYLVRVKTEKELHTKVVVIMRND
jgi:hypothetical protein